MQRLAQTQALYTSRGVARRVPVPAWLRNRLPWLMVVGSLVHLHALHHSVLQLCRAAGK
jgi:hypothetical protein